MPNNATALSEDFIDHVPPLAQEASPPIDPNDLTHIIRPFLVRNRIPMRDATAYCDRVYRDWRELRSVLPVGKSHILDIGSGYAGHDLYLTHYYKTAHFSLIDGTKTVPKAHSGFREDSMPYRNGNIGMRLLINQGFRARLYPVGEETSNLTLTWVDFVVSFCAYGHHFPIVTYLPLVQRSLVTGGHVLLDIRRDTNGREQMEVAGFEVVHVVKEKPKFTRTLFIKK